MHRKKGGEEGAILNSKAMSALRYFQAEAGVGGQGRYSGSPPVSKAVVSSVLLADERDGEASSQISTKGLVGETHMSSLSLTLWHPSHLGRYLKLLGETVGEIQYLT